MEAGYTHTHQLLAEENGRLALVILIKMRPSDGRYPIQKHLKNFLSKAKNFDELEEELYSELYRREADSDKPGSLNQFGGLEEKNDDEKEKSEEWPEQIWQEVWSPEYGWVQTLQALETKRHR